MAEGLGPDSFDCSGLAIQTVSELLGEPILSLAEGLRHVRDIWSDANHSQARFKIGHLAVGAFVVTKRQYEIQGQSLSIAGHVAIVTSLSSDRIDIIHANPSVGCVEERPIRTLETVLGYVSLTD